MKEIFHQERKIQCFCFELFLYKKCRLIIIILQYTITMGNSKIAKIDNKTLRILAQEGEQEVKKGLVFENKLLLTEEENKMFACMDWMKIEEGTSPSLQFMLHIPTRTKWMSKCSALSLIRMNRNYNVCIDTPTDPINEYKEMLALGLYSFFGVSTP